MCRAVGERMRWSRVRSLFCIDSYHKLHAVECQELFQFSTFSCRSRSPEKRCDELIDSVDCLPFIRTAVAMVFNIQFILTWKAQRTLVKCTCMGPRIESANLPRQMHCSFEQPLTFIHYLHYPAFLLNSDSVNVANVGAASAPRTMYTCSDPRFAVKYVWRSAENDSTKFRGTSFPSYRCRS